MTAARYDLFVIGAGSGGVRAARIAAGHGARVAIAESDRFGGTCVIRGCVPKKLLVYASGFESTFGLAAGYGWTVGPRRFDWAGLIAAKDREIGRLEGIYAGNLEKAGVTLIRDHAALAGQGRVRLKSSSEDIAADRILIATGARPFLPALPGIELAITSNEVFHLPALPRRAIVVGGGYIAVEFAGIFNGLGVETTQIYRGPTILRGFDDDLRTGLQAEMAKKGIDIRTGSDVVALEKTATGIAVVLGNGERIEADIVLYATGRVPNTIGLGLETVGIEVKKSGAIPVDERSQTPVAGLYAVGDVTGRASLTPVAIREGHAFADSEFGGRPETVDHSLIPTAVFSQPEIGTVGLTEAQAIEKYPAIDVYRTEFRPMRLSFAGRDEKTMMKIVVDAETDRVLGVHLIGAEAGELIQIVGVAMTAGATKRDFDRTIAVHPTAAEELVTMRAPAVRHRR